MHAIKKTLPARKAPVYFKAVAATRLAAIAVLASPAAMADKGTAIETEACEAALARSALPARLRGDATVYVWKDGDYQRSGAGDAKFHCFVARNHPDSVIPQCFTRSGVDSILAGEFFKSRRVMHGDSPQDAVRQFDEKVTAGEFAAPAAPGINYMMSAYNRIYQASRSEFIAVPPHVMFFAPHVNAEDVGSATFQEAVARKGIPTVVESGIHAYMVTFTEGSSDSSEVEQQCGEQQVMNWFTAGR